MAYIKGKLTNRDFYKIDECFGLRIGDEIKARLESNEEISVLDIACGANAEAITHLTQLYPGVRGIGLDYHLDPDEEQTNRLRLEKGDLFDIHFKDVADIAYCAFVLHDITGDLDEFIEKVAEAVFQIAETLKKGGIAFIDEGALSRTEFSLGALREKIEEEHPGFSEHYMVGNNPELQRTLDNYLIVRRN